jgi:putative ABC transport system permease protein
MNPSLAALWRIARRDLSARIRGLRLLAVCLFLGVTTLAAIGSLTAGIADELSQRGQTILGGDIQIEMAQRTASAQELAAFRKLGMLSQTVRMRAMAINGANGESLLTELKAVDGAYPLFGAMKLQGDKSVKAPPIGQIFIAPELSLKINDRLRFGDASFTIAGIIAEEPDRLGEGFTLGPVALISMDSLPSTNMIQPGSLYKAKYRVKLRAGANPDQAAQSLKKQFPAAGLEITDRSNGAPGTRRFVERMGQFLTLVGLAALVIAGIGVGNGVSSYLSSKNTSIATLKVIGADSAVIFRLYLMQILLVAVLSILAGLLVGSIAPAAISWAIGDILPMPKGFHIYPAPLIISAIYGLLIAISFALPPLSRSRFIPASGLFRSVLQGGKRFDRRALVGSIAALCAIVLIAIGTSREPLFSVGFISAAVGFLLILMGTAAIIRFIALRIPRPKAPLLRLALANLHRPGASTSALVVALGLGLTLFVTLATIQTSVRNEIARTVPQRAPSFFVLDIPRAETGRFETIIKQAAPNAVINMIPALRGRIIAYSDTRVDELETIPEGAWILNGDRGLTYSTDIPQGSKITDGAWWAREYRGPPLVSMEQDVAKSMGVGIGDTISISLLGVEVSAKITSLRKVEWDNFGLNYVMVFSPGSLDAAPHNMVATLTVPKSAEGTLAKQLPLAFPSLSLIEIGDVVSQVTGLLEQMARAIAAAASIAIFAGIAVLVGAIATSRAVRIYDSVILKLLGATRMQILGAQAIEYAILAGILGVISLLLGLSAGWIVITQIFKFSFAPDWGVLALVLMGGAGITFILGIAGSLKILSARPAQALRSL